MDMQVALRLWMAQPRNWPMAWTWVRKRFYFPWGGSLKKDAKLWWGERQGGVEWGYRVPRQPGLEPNPAPAWTRVRDDIQNQNTSRLGAGWPSLSAQPSRAGGVGRCPLPFRGSRAGPGQWSGCKQGTLGGLGKGSLPRVECFPSSSIHARAPTQVRHLG